MEENPRTTVRSVLEEFGSDPEALAVEVLALRRVVAELRSLLDDEPRGPFVIVSPPSPPHEPERREPWGPIPPRMAS